MSELYDEGLEQATSEVVHGFSRALLKLIGVNAICGMLAIFVALEFLR